MSATEAGEERRGTETGDGRRLFALQSTPGVAMNKWNEPKDEIDEMYTELGGESGGARK
jgi:hypothetical protein